MDTLSRLRRLKVIFQLTALLAVSFFFVGAIHEFVLQPFITSGDSMAPAFQSGEYLVIDEISYNFHKPARGDVVVFRYPLDPSIYFIKRIVGIPGDVKDGEVLGPSEYYMLGDNSAASFDSRSWGPVQERYIVGRPILRLFPFTSISLLPGTSITLASTSVQPLSTGKR